MVTVSSAFISSRRERIIFSVLSASGCAFKAAALVGVLRGGLAVLPAALLSVALPSLALLPAVLLEAALRGVFVATDLDKSDVARAHSFHCIASAESRRPPTILGMWG